MADDLSLLAPLAPERPSSSSSVEDEDPGKRQRVTPVTRQPLLGTTRVDMYAMPQLCRAYVRGTAPRVPYVFRTRALAQGLVCGTAHTRTWAFGTTGASMEDAIALLRHRWPTSSSQASSQADGCLALAKLLRHNVLPGVARSAAVKQGAIDLLVTALRTHPHDTAVQARASLRRMP